MPHSHGSNLCSCSPCSRRRRNQGGSHQIQRSRTRVRSPPSPPTLLPLTIQPCSMPPQSYISTILKPSSWGGAIELSVLVDYYNAQILSIDVETGRVDTFDPQVPTGQTCILLYSGIHYDTVFLTPDLDAPREWRQTLFPVRVPSCLLGKFVS